MPGASLALLRDCKMVLCAPCGGGDGLTTLREYGVPAVGLDPDAAAVTACLARGLVAFHGSLARGLTRRHAFDGAVIDLAGTPADDVAAALRHLDDALLPGARLLLRGTAEPPPALADWTFVQRHAAALLLRKPRGAEPEPPARFVAMRVGPYADLFVGCRQVLELGAGRGRFLDALHLREMPCLGIEPDAALAAEARRAGHDVRTGGLDLLATLAPGIDGIFVGPCLEPLPAAQRRSVVQACRHLLPPNGRLVVRGRRERLADLAAAFATDTWQAVHQGAAPGDPHDGFVLALATAEAVAAPAQLATVPLATRDLPMQAPLRSLFDLERFERRVHSQGGEDGVLAALFALLGTTDRSYVEFGCGDGVQCNTAALRRQGWHGVLMDGVCEPGADDVVIHAEWITADNIEALFDRHGVPDEPDLMSIDLDGNDYWVWRAIRRRPRVVVAEYNANLAADRALTIAYDPAHRWAGTDHYGASLLALVQLGREKGYTLVYCTQAGVNAFFVRDDLLGDAPPVDAQLLYRPPNYWYRGARSLPDLSRSLLSV